ncbi:MAG: O-antigen ligase family protein [Desulfobacterales bacterium]|nr:O-antigen ligase family protein [Desulfobacterales bacterium]
MAAFAGYFFMCLIFFLANGLLREGMTLDWELDHESRLLGFIPIYYLLIHWTGMKKWVFWYGLAAGALCSVGYALIQAHMLASGNRITGPYNPIAFGNLTLVCAFMALSGIRYFYRRHPLLIIIPLLAVIGSILVAFLSGTRGTLFLIPILTLLFLIQLGSFKYTWIYRIIAILLILIPSVAYFQLSSVSVDDRLRDSLHDARQFFSGEREKLQGEEAYRLRVWTEGWKIYKKHPLFGAGKDQFIPELRKNTGLKAPHLHNMFLEFLVSYGILGPIALIAILFTPLTILIPTIRQHYNNPHMVDTAFSGLSLISAFLVFSLTTCIFYKNIFIAIYIILLATLFTIIKHEKCA